MRFLGLFSALGAISLASLACAPPQASNSDTTAASDNNTSSAPTVDRVVALTTLSADLVQTLDSE